MLSKPPKLLEVIEAPETERGAVDARRTRLVTSTRFAFRAGAERQLYVGAPMTNGRDASTQMIPLGGAWATQAVRLGLQTPEKNPMSIVIDRDKLAYGCTDGTIVVVSFAEQT